MGYGDSIPLFGVTGQLRMCVFIQWNDPHTIGSITLDYEISNAKV